MITPKRNTGVRMPERLNRELSEIAKYKGVSKNAVMLEALWQFVERNKQKERSQGE